MERIPFYLPFAFYLYKYSQKKHLKSKFIVYVNISLRFIIKSTSTHKQLCFQCRGAHIIHSIHEICLDSAIYCQNSSNSILSYVICSYFKLTINIPCFAFLLNIFQVKYGFNCLFALVFKSILSNCLFSYFRSMFTSLQNSFWYFSLSIFSCFTSQFQVQNSNWLLLHIQNEYLVYMKFKHFFAHLLFVKTLNNKYDFLLKILFFTWLYSILFYMLL